MLPELKSLLDHLENTLDPEREAAIARLHHDALLWKPVERLPLVLSYPIPDDTPFKPFPHREIFDNPEKMLYNELTDGFMTSIALRDRIDDDLPCSVRPNFGTVLVASMFGAHIEQTDDNPPWVRAFKELDEYDDALFRDIHDFSQGWCPKAVEVYEFFHEAFSRYPVVRETVKIVLPDLQGPIDTADLLRGCEIYPDFYLSPELAKRGLEKITEAQIALANRFLPYTTDRRDGMTCQHATYVRGQILIRNDSAIMVSPEMYREQVAEHDERVLAEFEGGGIHACGSCQHVVKEFLRLASLQCLDLGQPEMNDTEEIYELARQRQIPIIRIRVSEEELTSGRVMRRFPTGVTLVHTADSFEDARRIVEEYKGACLAGA